MLFLIVFQITALLLNNAIYMRDVLRMGIVQRTCFLETFFKNNSKKAILRHPYPKDASCSTYWPLKKQVKPDQRSDPKII